MLIKYFNHTYFLSLNGLTNKQANKADLSISFNDLLNYFAFKTMFYFFGVPILWRAIFIWFAIGSKRNLRQDRRGDREGRKEQIQLTDQQRKRLMECTVIQKRENIFYSEGKRQYSHFCYFNNPFSACHFRKLQLFDFSVQTIHTIIRNEKDKHAKH